MNEKLKVIIDTNVYESLHKKYLPDVVKLVESGKIIVYGCKIIRDELRDIPKTTKYEGKSYRNLLLSIYDFLVKDHSYDVVKVVEVLAEEYWKEYNGGVPKRKIFPDFVIVAVASLYKLNIIISEDEHSMKSKIALKAYFAVNKRNGLDNPTFSSINDLI